MSKYLRQYIHGGCYFITMVTFERRLIFDDRKNIALLKSAIDKVKIRHPFLMQGLVILPDHLHCLMKLPSSSSDFSTIIRLIKRQFSTQLSTGSNERGEKLIWQRRFWEHSIRDEYDWKSHLDYIHYNPIKHGYVCNPNEWGESSFSYWVEKGLYEENWSMP